MATFRKRNDRWQVQVRRKGFPLQTRSFLSKADAKEWARLIEGQADRQELGPDRKELKTITLSDLVTRYLKEVVPKKKGSNLETIFLKRFLRYPICRKTLSDLTTSDFAAYRDQRLTEPKARSNRPITPKSLKRQLAPLSHMFRHAQTEWEIPLKNPLEALKLRVVDNRRERRLRKGDIRPDGTYGPTEEARLLEAAKKARNPYVVPIILFALETAMRRGEILAIRWRDVDLSRFSVVIPESKSGYSRVIPLTDKAVAILAAIRKPDFELSDRAFPTSPVALRLSWDRITERAKLEDLNFHDLRHEAISRLFELGLTVPEVASISGHRTLGQLMRYSHASDEAVRRKLSLRDGREGSKLDETTSTLPASISETLDAYSPGAFLTV